MREKQGWIFLTGAVFLIVILTALFASDKKKSLQVIKIDNVELNTLNVSFSKRNLIEKLNKDPRYSHLSAPEKVRLIVETLRKEKGLQTSETKHPKDSKKAQNNSKSAQLKQH